MTKTHDYTKRYWGHDFVISDVIGLRLWAHGWGLGIRSGDYLILPNGTDTTRYVVDAVRYEADPYDMWFADLVFAPREASVQQGS